MNKINKLTKVISRLSETKDQSGLYTLDYFKIKKLNGGSYVPNPQCTNNQCNNPSCTTGKNTGCTNDKCQTQNMENTSCYNPGCSNGES